MPRSREKLLDVPPAPLRVDTEEAHLILKYAREAAHALLTAFDNSRSARRATGGNTTDEEQDLLRAMLVFAGAGLDASLKQLIEDALPTLARLDVAVWNSLQAFAARRLRTEAATYGDSARGYALLATALVSLQPQSAIINAYVDELIGGSLQSVDRLLEAVGALGLPKRINVNREELKRVFEARNNIVHGMDMNLSGKSLRMRTTRSRDPMIAAVNRLLGLGWQIVAAVDERIPAPTNWSAIFGGADGGAAGLQRASKTRKKTN